MWRKYFEQVRSLLKPGAKFIVTPYYVFEDSLGEDVPFEPSLRFFGERNGFEAHLADRFDPELRQLYSVFATELRKYLTGCQPTPYARTFSTLDCIYQLFSTPSTRPTTWITALWLSLIFFDCFSTLTKCIR